MSNYNSLKTTIDANIKQNGRQEITGQILNSVLNQMVTTLGAGYQFAGVATTATNPGTPDAKVFYIANGKGTYEKFGGINVTEDEVVVLYYDTAWHKVATGIASQEKLSELEIEINDLGEKVKDVYVEESEISHRTDTSGLCIISEKEPTNVTIDIKSIVRIHSRNRFNLEKATFTPNSYSEYHTITKENNGVKIICSLAYTAALNVATTYIAEFDGLLYVSVDADCDGSINDLGFRLAVNGTSLDQIVYGKGLLYQAVQVSKGDSVQLRLYSKINTPIANTLYYKNIMFAYGGLYPYSPYSPTETNVVESALQMPSNPDSWENATTNQSGVYRSILLNYTFPYPPSSGDEVADVRIDGYNLVTYNQTFQRNNGLGIANTGKISIYKDGLSRIDIANWLASNPVTIYYESDKFSDTINHNFQQGEIVESSDNTLISYKYKKDIKKVNCVCFGDSITGMFKFKTDYPTMITRETDIDCKNVGFSGCQFTDHADNRYKAFSMNRLVDAIISNDWSLQDAGASALGGIYAKNLATLKSIDFKKIDFVTIFYGTNDWGANAILDSSSDTSSSNKQRTNLEDAVKYSIENLLTAYPNLRIVVISPYWRSITSGKDSNVDANERGDYLYQFADKIEEISRRYNLPTINLYREFGANAFTNRYYTSDGTHPTEWSKHSISHRIIDVINKNR